MSILARLPPVLVPEVAQDLSLRELLNLCKVSKACHSLFERELYRSVLLTFDHSQNSSTKGQSIRQLLANLLRRPEIAVWILSFTARETGFGPKPRLGAVLSTSELLLLHSILGRAKMADIDSWMSDLRQGDLETIVAMIIVQLPQVQSLTLDLFFRHDDDTAYLENERNRIQQVLALAVAAPVERSELPGVMPVLFLPALDCATLKIDQPEAGIRGLARREPKQSRLRLLRLRYSSISDGVLATITAAAPRLRALDIEFDRDMRCLDESETPGFHGPSLLASLSPCQVQLESLRIVCHINDPFLEVPWSCFFTHPIGSLRDFGGLRSLEVELALLLGRDQITAQGLADALPLSLSRIGIREDGYGVASIDAMEEAIREFPAIARSALLQLNKVEIFADVQVWGQKRMSQIQAAYESTPLDLAICHIERLAPEEIF
ncbi:unnamed protein product [Clonostachys rosea]|uniref:F-box domain-containing protein n=1 Tax=Bionectria ochroleuca TaxID=29856 RepID=A0ABY6U7W4_BIOOC|nr:unnamed protein product [Clonostachys rosea]